MLILRQTRDFHHRPDLDRAPTTTRYAGGNIDRFVEIRRVDEVVAAELFARLRERTVGYQPFAVPHPDAGRRRAQVEWGGAQIPTAVIEVSGKLRGLAVALLPLLRVYGILGAVNQQHVFHTVTSICARP